MQSIRIYAFLYLTQLYIVTLKPTPSPPPLPPFHHFPRPLARVTTQVVEKKKIVCKLMLILMRRSALAWFWPAFGCLDKLQFKPTWMQCVGSLGNPYPAPALPCSFFGRKSAPNVACECCCSCCCFFLFDCLPSRSWLAGQRLRLK